MTKVEILHRYDVSPPANTVPPTALPLTFFDILFLRCCPMQRLFFYDFPQSPPSFANTTLPLLVRSLSLCLRRFFPFSGNLVLPLAPPQKPHILYSDGDSLSLTVAQSAADFAELISDEPHDATLIHPLVPQFPPPRESNGARLWPLMAIQVTLFPNKVICIGVRFLHIAADGRSFNHFMKSWASIYRSEGDPTCIDLSEAPLAIGAQVRATFVFKKAHIDGLKVQVLSQLKSATINLVSDPDPLVNISDEEHQRHDQSKSDKDELRHFCFLADCRGRLEYSIPSTYFGNCLSICFLSEKKNTLLSKSGLSHAAMVIVRRVTEIETGGALRELEGWMRGLNITDITNLVTVAVSPRLKAYDTDFGWGRLRKSSLVHIDQSGSISLMENKDEDGGVEIGLALTRICMEKFISLFEKGLKSFIPL
ncbi:hypothetical protein BT93_L2474 [Corymbia citriodora subsp. variegata]|uniref:Uncharacterized protein n=1 Tax=Corymbia citriodora subsp. variegata TaxID=360336 RepID=A0A8T0CJP1_CORYI|nr:hypothetical protein BT93_L2474 [Corymbia citriodora subsp. variegata]